VGGCLTYADTDAILAPYRSRLGLRMGVVPQGWSIYPTESTAYRYGWGFGTPQAGEEEFRI